MTDDDFTLNPSESARWDDIVTREWPSPLAHPTMQARHFDQSANATALDKEMQATLTIYLPRRPAVLPLGVSAMLASAAAWVAVDRLGPAYQLAVLTGVARRDRVDAVQHLTVTAAAIAVILLLAATGCATWLVSFARYRLRRAACEQVADGTPTTTRYVRPPNPVTAIIWVLLLLTGSTTAYWWIGPRLDKASSTQSDTVPSLSQAAGVGLAWLAVMLLCVAGISAWAAREARHRLRRAASTDN